MVQRQRKLSTMLDMYGTPLRCQLEYQLPPFLPPPVLVQRRKREDDDDDGGGGEEEEDHEEEVDPKWERIYNELLNKQQKLKKKKKKNRKGNDDNHEEEDQTNDKKNNEKHIQPPSCGWTLLTGASRGIGRALAVELARHKVPLILVARNEDKLKELATQLEECYGIPTMVFVSDFSHSDAAERLIEQIHDSSSGSNDSSSSSSNKKVGGTKSNNDKNASVDIDCLIHNAGIGDAKEIVNMDTKRIQDIITINTMTGSKLCQMLGRHMKRRRRGRIVLMSSITGMAPGIPTAAVYAATKAFQRSFAVSMGLELEPYGVGVTCIMPGAVHDTDFASESNMKDATIWKIPFGKITAQVVARSTVNAMIRGSPEIVVGWFNTLSVKFVFLLLPDRLISIICRWCWNPPPFLK